MNTVDLSSLRHADFALRIGDTFVLHVNQETRIDVVLAEASEVSSAVLRQELEAGQRNRLPFQMMFRGPLQPELVQRMYALQHEDLGTLELFLVPVERKGGSMWYEAVFT